MSKEDAPNFIYKKEGNCSLCDFAECTTTNIYHYKCLKYDFDIPFPVNLHVCNSYEDYDYNFD